MSDLLPGLIVLAIGGSIAPPLLLLTILISGMLGALFAKRPITLRQCLRTRADIVEYVQEQEGRVR